MKKVFRGLVVFLMLAATIFGCFTASHGIGKEKPLKDAMKYGLDINGGVYVVMEAETDATGEELSSIMSRTKSVMERRVNAMGISEANVIVEGSDRIRVELPGVEDADEAIEQIGRTAQLAFLLADGTVVMDGNAIKDAQATTDNEHGGYKIVLDFTSDGSVLFEEATRKASSGEVTPIEGLDSNMLLIMLDNEIISSPTCSTTISGLSCEITSPNGMSQSDAMTTAQLIKGGALPVSLKQLTSSYQSATIGSDALDKAVIAGGIGLLIVFIVMVFAFGVMGLIADIALILYVLADLYFMRAIGAVLTLPGIAGIILSIGMAVDANVIIFSRIREEVLKGRSGRLAVDEGFSKGTSAVMDGQITTLIAALVLYLIGTTSVKGFALTLMIGVVLSIITAVFVTKIYLTTLIHVFPGMKLGKVRIKTNINFIKHRKAFAICSLIVVLIGAGFMVGKGMNYGVDFTGGTMIQVALGEEISIDEVKDSISSLDLDESVVYGNDERTEVIIKTKDVIEDRSEITKALTGLSDEAEITAFETFGPTIGKELVENAIKSILIAVICMLVYIRFRFKDWRFGGAAVLGLIHDVLVTIAVFAVFSLTINNPFIAGILTVVGYSINDTIVIFDRIRENRTLYSKNSLTDVMNRSINETLSRALLTSITTLGAILPLFVMVSSELREFTIPLIIGVIVGTYSSIFLCTPFLYQLLYKGELSRYERKTGVRLKEEY